ncbi:hypothetical protein HAX54_024597 [Datura stramonium]|uniref:Uncharacterized protein n=1 Tax=Datura stramonium TaxID=4076 RepID=A0ABS8UYE2_DATST|nr:hypothetical protein [Datura stramonium]
MTAAALTQPPTELQPIEIINGEPTIVFKSSDIEGDIKEKILQYALAEKFSHGRPIMTELRKFFPQQLKIKGACNIDASSSGTNNNEKVQENELTLPNGSVSVVNGKNGNSVDQVEKVGQTLDKRGHKIGNTTGENNASEDGDVQVVGALNNDNFVDPGHVKEVREYSSGIKKNFVVDGVIKTTPCDDIPVQTIASQPENLKMVVASKIHDRQVQIAASKHGEKTNDLQVENFSSDENAIGN